jgi:uncharacterized protein (DUF4415 family)
VAPCFAEAQRHRNIWKPAEREGGSGELEKCSTWNILYLPDCMYNKDMSMKTKRRTKTAKSGRIARIRAAAEELRRSPEMAEMYRPIKKPVTLRLDADVIAWFKAQGRGYQTRINRALRGVMLGEKEG